jgi:hypothetical protein
MINELSIIIKLKSLNDGWMNTKFEPFYEIHRNN